MANAVKWSALGSFTTLIAGSGSPTLKALASAGQKIGNAIDNSDSAARHVYAELVLKVRFASAPTANSVVELYLIEGVDGSTYQDGDDSVVPPLSALIATFSVRAVTTQQLVAFPRVILPPTLFKPLIINKGGQAFTNTDDENILSYRPYNTEIQ